VARIRYRIEPRDPEAHRYAVSLVIEDPDPAGARVWMPTWVPGSYLIREFARHVVRIEATAAGGRLDIEKIDKHGWRCAPAPAGASVEIRYEVYAWDLSVRAAHLDASHAYFNGAAVFLAVAGREAEPCVVEIAPPPGPGADWRVATTLPRDGAPAWGFGRYRAHDYDALIDHPVECGRFDLVSFDVLGVAHDVAITGRHRGNLERIAADLARVCRWHVELFGAPPPFERYLFLVTVVGEGYGGLEHRDSTSLLCSRDDLPRDGDGPPGERYRGFLGLASHEYFHAWNVKRIRPQAFVPFDLSREAYTRQLWAFEGITSYYDDLALVRCGLLRETDYLELLGETLTRVLRTHGRHVQSVAESSFDAWIKFYRPDENTPNGGVSYYAKGSLVALALDLMLRAHTAGARSLDDLMRRLWHDYGQTGRGVPEGRIEALVSELAGVDLTHAVRELVHGTGDPPLTTLLESVGVRLGLRAATGESDKGGRPAPDGRPRAWLGARVGGDGRLAVVHEDSPAQRAGLSAGDQLVAFDAVRAGGLDALLASRAPGSVVEVHAFRRDELFRCEVRLEAAPADTAFLEIDAQAPATAQAARRAWLGEARPASSA
jgi:predicted metalloprotease with PDZ domain